MRKPEDVMEVMLEGHIGECFAKTYSQIADFFELQLLDFRKADKVYRMGQQNLRKLLAEPNNAKEKKLEKELGNLKTMYERFCERMTKRVE